MEFKKFSAGKFSYGNSLRKFIFYSLFISLADNRNDMRLHMDNEEGEEISNVNFHDESFYNHWRSKKSEN
jgi:hypothetical protein